MMRWVTAVPLALAAFLPLSAAPAKADTHAMIHQAFSAAEAMAEGWADRAVDRAQDYAAAAHDAILIGGIIISQNRNTISGGTIGCALGAASGVGSTVALALPTGGAALAATPNATLLGCALGAAGGAALGYQLDYPAGR